MEDLSTANCYKCQKIAASQCGRCLKTPYCSPECQTTDWSEHKKTCKKPIIPETCVMEITRDDIIKLIRIGYDTNDLLSYKNNKLDCSIKLFYDAKKIVITLKLNFLIPEFYAMEEHLWYNNEKYNDTIKEEYFDMFKLWIDSPEEFKYTGLDDFDEVLDLKDLEDSQYINEYFCKLSDEDFPRYFRGYNKKEVRSAILNLRKYLIENPEKVLHF